MANIISNLLLYYRFDTDDLSGSTLRNIATGNYDGICSSTSIISKDIYYIGCSALNLIKNSNSYLYVNNFNFPTDFTISFWVYCLGNNMYGNISARIFEYYLDSTTYFAFTVTNGVFEIFSTNSGSQVSVLTVPINNGIWTHIIVTYKNSTKSLQVYINGILNVNQILLYSINVSSNVRLWFGTDHTQTYNLIGILDDFRVYNYVITSQTDINYLCYYPNYNIYTNNLSNISLTNTLYSNFYDKSNNNFVLDYEPRNITPGKIVLFLGKPTIQTNNFGNYANTITFSSINQAVFNNNYLYVIDDIAGTISIINMFSGIANVITNNKNINSVLKQNIRSIELDNSNNYYYISDLSNVMQFNLTTNYFVQYINSTTFTNSNFIIADINNILYISHNTGISKINLNGTLPAAPSVVITTSIRMGQMAISPLSSTTLYAIDISNIKIYVINTSTNTSYNLILPSSFIYSSAILTSICFDSIGNLYVSTTNGTYAVYIIPYYVLNTYSANTTLSNKEIILYAGIGGTSIGTTGYSGDGGYCYNALFSNISNIMMDVGDNMYISDSSNCTIRKIINKIQNTNFINTISNNVEATNKYDISTLYSPNYSIYTNTTNYCIGNLNNAIDTQINSVNFNIIDTSGLILYYRFNSTDVSGLNLANFNTGFPIYDASLSATSLINSSNFVLHNSGFSSNNSGYITIHNSTLSSIWPTTNGFSISLWIKSNNSGSNSRIFDFGDTNLSPANSVMINIIDNIITFTIIKQGTFSYYSTNFQINDNIWHHVCYTVTYISTTSSTQVCYIDGSSYNTTSGTYPTFTTYSSCLIGKSNFASDPSFNGYIDDLRLYNRVITSNEVSILYNMAPNRQIIVDLSNIIVTKALTGNNNLTYSYYFSTPIVNSTTYTIGTGYYTSTGSSSSSSTTQPSYAFDQNLNTSWISNTVYDISGIYIGSQSTVFSDTTSVLGEWIQIKLPYNVRLTSYTVGNDLSYSTIPIKEYVLAGSTDGTTWYYIDNILFNTVNNVQTFTIYPYTNVAGNNWTFTTFKIGSNNYYSYFRFIVKSMVNTTNARIADLQLYGLGQITENLPINNTYSLSIYNSIPVISSNTTLISGYIPNIINGTYYCNASSSLTGSSPYYAFDFNNSSYWTSSGGYNGTTGTYLTSRTINTFIQTVGGISGEWIQIQLPYFLSLSGYSMMSRSLFSQFPNTWYLVGSTDNSTWYPIDYRNGISASSMIYYNFGNSYSNYNYYNYFRIITTKNNINGSTSITQILLNGLGKPT